VLISWGNQWWQGRVVQAYAEGSVRVTYDGWSSSFDETVPRSRLRLTGEPHVIAADDTPEPASHSNAASGAVTTQRFEIRRYLGTDPDPQPAAERELQSLEGYVHGSLVIDPAGQTISLQVVSGSKAEPRAIIALMRQRLMVRRLR
jgi:hypothetical protein